MPLLDHTDLSLVFLVTCVTVCLMSVHLSRPGTDQTQPQTHVFPAVSSVPRAALAQGVHVANDRSSTALVHRGLGEAETPRMEGLSSGPRVLLGALCSSLSCSHFLSCRVQPLLRARLHSGERSLGLQLSDELKRQRHGGKSNGVTLSLWHGRDGCILPAPAAPGSPSG